MKRILMMACAVAALASCSKETNEPTMQGNASIKANSVIEGVTTRAITGTDAALSDIVFLRQDDASSNLGTFDFSSSATISGIRAASGGAITFNPDQKYDQVNDETSYILGYHPTGTLNNKVVTWTPDGATDILMTDVWNAGRYSAPITTGMTFRHILARIEVICKAESGAALSVVQAMWGNIESIKFASALPTMTYTYSTNVVDATGSAADFTLLNGDTYATGAFTAVAIPANNSTAVTASAMLPPTASTGISLKVKTVDQSEITVPIALSGNFVNGKIHKVTLTFNADGKKIDATASTIEDWTTGETGSGDVVVTP